MEEIQEVFLYGDSDQFVDPTKVLSDTDSKKWKEAMQSKMESIYSNQV